MKNILFIAFLTLSLNAFGQTENPKIVISFPPTLDTPVKPKIPPLLVWDGKVSQFKEYSAFEEKLKNIKPNDIQSIDVIKGENAVKLYGEQGLQGVIVITMKK